MNNNIDYNFLNTEFNAFEKGNNLKMFYFFEGNKKFLLQTNIMESYQDYIFLKKENSADCILDTILIDFDFQNIDQDTLKNISIFSDSVSIVNYNNIGDSIFEIFSQELIHYSNEDIVELKKNVQLKNFNNHILKTNRLFWNIDKKKILSLDSVSIQTSDKIIHGCGFYSDDNFENYQIYNIHGVIQIDSD
jgi:hypothetical protein